MKSLVAVLAAGLMAVVVACAGAGHKAAMAPASGGQAPQAPMAPMSPEAQQIDTWANEIERDRQTMGLEAPHEASVPHAAVAMSSPLTVQSDAACHPAKTDTCTQSCTLSDSICNNSAKICDLASKMAGDDWAAKKCGTARETCEAGHKKCCDCQ
jgi:hypothetical protein